MASESSARSSDPATSVGKTEPPAASERSRRSDRRIPTARETAATLPEIESDTAGFDFEPHDTIPAPPWLGDDIPPPAKT
jgi:hypothetical protein